VAVLCNKV